MLSAHPDALQALQAHFVGACSSAIGTVHVSCQLYSGMLHKNSKKIHPLFLHYFLTIL